MFTLRHTVTSVSSFQFRPKIFSIYMFLSQMNYMLGHRFKPIKNYELTKMYYVELGYRFH